MSQKPPRVAAWLVELFAPKECAEGVLGDLEEEFGGRLSQSGHPAARRWYWRQAVKTNVHLIWGSVRTAPLSTLGLALASFVAAYLLFGVLNIWLARLVSNLPIYDYTSSIWSWRVAALARFVAIPLALGWSIAVAARNREMTITTLVVVMLLGLGLWGVIMSGRQIVVLAVERFGSHWALMHGPRIVMRQLVSTTVPLTTIAMSLLIGGMLRRMQRIRAARVGA